MKELIELAVRYVREEDLILMKKEQLLSLKEFILTASNKYCFEISSVLHSFYSKVNHYLHNLIRHQIKEKLINLNVPLEAVIKELESLSGDERIFSFNTQELSANFEFLSIFLPLFAELDEEYSGCAIGARVESLKKHLSEKHGYRESVAA